jgi:Domain of unknown function (DUF4158)
VAVALKCFQRLGYFPRAEQVPPAVIERVRGRLGLSEASGWQPPDRTGRWQQQLVRERLGVVSDPKRARSLVEQAIRSEAEVKNHPPDLINVALEVLVREELELPAFSTLNGIAIRVRAEVNAGMFSGIVARMRQPEVLRVNNLLEVVDGKRGFDAFKQAAGKVRVALGRHRRIRCVAPATAVALVIAQPKRRSCDHGPVPGTQPSLPPSASRRIGHLRFQIAASKTAVAASG